METTQMKTYIVISDKPWVKRLFHKSTSTYPGRWMLCEDDCQMNWAIEQNPRYVFFLHWSHKVPPTIIDRFECINFHMTALPYGRGGSPLQNLIVMGHEDTLVTAHRMTSEIDAGPIYLQNMLSLNGLAEEIYLRAMGICFDMMEAIAAIEPVPVPQQGEPTYFKRRTPDQSFIMRITDLEALFDHLRMLDCEGYPRAYLEHQGFRFEFSRPALRDGRIEADVRITKER